MSVSDFDVGLIAPWLQTLHGRAFRFDDVDNNEFDAEEVAVGLARTGRFANQCRWRYSVAQHSVLVSRKFDTSLHKMVSLLHDVSECWLGDMTSPVKVWLKSHGNDAYKELETRIQAWAARRHNFDPTRFDDIEYQDLTALATEKRDLMVEPPLPWIELPRPWPERIEVWSEEYASDEWLRSYQELIV